MGLKIRSKDKVFVALVLPATAFWAYWHFYRGPAEARLSELDKMNAALFDDERFSAEMDKAVKDRAAAREARGKADAEKARVDAEKVKADAELVAANAQVADEKAVALPPPKVVADPAVTAAQRENQVMTVFREAGLFVAKVEAVPAILTAAALSATGSCPAPISRRYVLEGKYSQVKSALVAFAARKMAVIVGKVAMNESGAGRWMVEVAL